MRWMKPELTIHSEVSGICGYVEFRKMVTMILQAGEQKRHRCKEQNFGLCGRRRGWDDLKEQH